MPQMASPARHESIPQQSATERHAADAEDEHGELVCEVVAFHRPHPDQQEDADCEESGLQSSGGQIGRRGTKVLAAEYPKHQHADRRHNDGVEQHQRGAEGAVDNGDTDAIAEEGSKKKNANDPASRPVRHEDLRFVLSKLY